MSAATIPARSAGGPDLRGNNRDRRRRKRWLLTEHGDGVTAPCWLCDAPVTLATVTVDRIIPQAEGGTYARVNIMPACGPCNYGRGANDPDAWRGAGFGSPV